MTMVSTGPISLAGNATTGGLNQSVNIELGRAATATINMNESAVRTLAAVPSGAISMSNFYGKSDRVIANVTIGSDTTNYVVNTAKAAGYVAGKTDFTLTINSGVFVYSTSTGAYALQVDTSWTTGDTVTIINNGVIIGRGGNGGNGGTQFGPASGVGGGTGGPALLVQRATSINNLNRISGGGGGGGGGALGGRIRNKSLQPSGGGGGGGGIGVSSGGTGGFGFNQVGQPGGGGSLFGAGGGGSGFAGGPGGSGGTYATSGSPGANGPNTGNVGGGGGGGGAAVVGNGNITWINFGTRNGAIS
jgi:hypothetical protein